MALNNAWNTKGIATTAIAIAGTATDYAMSPANVQSVMNINRLKLADWENLGIKYASGTFSICAANGQDLSAANYAKITLASNVTRGTIVRHTITANQFFKDATDTSTIIGNTFGTTASKAWSLEAPFFLYCAASSTDTNPTFFIARVAGRHTLPAASAIGQSGSAIADIDNGFFSFSAITAANYAGSTCCQIGTIRMTKNASDDWTVQALDATDGIGEARDDDWFDFPSGQQTATGTNYLIPNGGTAPTFATQAYRYNIGHDAICRIAVGFTNTTGGTAGSGAVSARMTLPFTSAFNTYTSSGIYTNNATINIIIWSVNTAGYTEMFRENTGAVLQNSSFNNAIREINGSFQYRIGETT